MLMASQHILDTLSQDGHIRLWRGDFISLMRSDGGPDFR
jgi:hypothetical protein